VHADAAAAAAAAAADAANGSSAAHDLAAGEKLAAAVSAEVSRQRFEALYENSDRMVHQANGSSRDFSSPADDEQLPLLAELGAHPVSAQHHATAAATAGDAQQPSSSNAVPAAAAAAAVPDAAAAAADAGPAMIGGGIPRSIFVLSMVSMALTSASCVFNTLLPIYMVTELKMTMRTMGMFEGMWGCWGSFSLACWLRARSSFVLIACKKC
jgi:hypothetical protein